MVVFIADRTATHPEARFDRVKDCLRTQCKRTRRTMNWFERTCRSETVLKRPRTGLKRAETYWGLGTRWIETAIVMHLYYFKLCCVVVKCKIARSNPSSSRFMKFSERVGTFFELVQCDWAIMAQYSGKNEF